MIDSHCHMEQDCYKMDLPAVIERCKAAGLKAVISVCAAPKDFQRTLEIAKRFPDFVFPVAGIHPEYIKEISAQEVDEFFEVLKKNSDKIYGIGEVGLDRFWIKEPEWQKKQEELFLRFIEFAKNLNKPLIVHSRDAYPEIIHILESTGIEKVHLHMWGGKNEMPRVLAHEWNISIGPVIATSKTHRKIAKLMPLERIFLETDSPWFGPHSPTGEKRFGGRLRGEPTNIKIPCEKIAKEKKISFEEVWRICGENAKRFYGLPLQ